MKKNDRVNKTGNKAEGSKCVKKKKGTKLCQVFTMQLNNYET